MSSTQKRNFLPQKRNGSTLCSSWKCSCKLTVVWTGGRGRFVKQEQWQRWGAKRILASGSKHRERLRRSGISPRKIFEIVMCKILHSYAFLTFFNTLTMRTAFHARVPLEMTSGLGDCCTECVITSTATLFSILQRFSPMKSIAFSSSNALYQPGFGECCELPPLPVRVENTDRI